MPLSPVAAALVACGALGVSSGQDLLVAMHGSGRIERYDGEAGEWVGTFASGLESPNALVYGPDGDVYVASGALGGPGCVQRLDGRTGAYVDEFVAPAPGADGYIARATDLLFHDGKLYVASCDNGKIIAYDGATGEWLGDFASAEPVSITEIEFRDGKLYFADFRTQSVQQVDIATGEREGSYTARSGFSPWGLAFNQVGNLFWSGSDHTIQRFDGTENVTWAGPGDPLDTPIHLECDERGRLFCSGFEAANITAWSTEEPNRLLLMIAGDEVSGPMGMAFTDAPRGPKALPMAHLGAWHRRKDRERHRIGGKPVLRVEARTDSASIEALGWDTEGGNRARLNLLRSPLKLRLLLDGRWRVATTIPTRVEIPGGDAVAYHLSVGPGRDLLWRIDATPGGGLEMDLRAPAGPPRGLKALEVVFPFKPRTACTTVISEQWTDDGEARLPAIISAPDAGQMHVTCEAHPELPMVLEGSRAGGTVTLTVKLPVPDEQGYSIALRPLRLRIPKGFQDRARWLQARRGWFNLIQLSARRAAEGSRPEHPSGVWANNVISDPVSSLLYMLADHALLVPEPAPGVRMAPVLRRTVEYWMSEGANEEGEIAYVVRQWSSMMDSNPAVVIGAWAYVEATADTDWLAEHIERLEFIAGYTARSDVDDDGLIESKQSGNRGTHAFGDTAWDTYSSGHKNAYVNALAYRAFCGMADMEGRLGRAEQRDYYDRLASRIKSAFLDTFYNPESGWLGWWRSEDGKLHDVNSDVPTSIAIMYGLVDDVEGRRMLDTYWEALQESGFDRFDLGVPLNIRPVHRDDQYRDLGGTKEDGSETFGKYLNGGCCVSNTYFFLAANYMVGATERADMILDAMLERQEKGVFPNGGGFQNGFVDRWMEGAEFYDWEGNPCGYEGHLVYSWAFLQAMLLRDPAMRERVFGLLM